MAYLTVNVTKTGIKKGVCRSCHDCPVARGLKAVGCTKVRVSLYAVCFVYKYEGYYLSLPNKVCKFIQDFDFKKEVKPFKFRLKLA